MKWVLIALGILIGLPLVAAAIGMILPKGHRASASATFAAPPARVFQAISDVGRYPEWRPDVKSVEVLSNAGEPTLFREHGRSGAVTFQFERADPDRLLVVRIADSSLPFGGTWTYELKPSGGGTELTITEDGEVYNPIFRLVSKFMAQDATIRAYLAALPRALTP